MGKRKRGVSPVIATVLLIALVIIIAVIILLWSTVFFKEKIIKFDKPVENVCSEVDLRTFINDDDTFGFTNIANVPIYRVDLKVSSDGSSEIIPINQGVDSGYSVILDEVGVGPYYSYDEVKIIPVLLGKTKDGGVKEFVCDEKYAFLV